MLAHLQHRPGLFTGAAAAVLGGFIASRFVPELSAVLIGWCAGVLVYVGIDIWVASRSTIRTMQVRAEAVGESRITVLLISLSAAVASLAAIVITLARAREAGHTDFATSLAAITVLLSWIFVHTVFAFTYAHDFYRECQGLTFPETPTPDYWDFVYFAFVIGATAQVSDVAITSASIRRLALLHGIISFFFNTAILAFGVNLAASLVT